MGEMEGFRFFNKPERCVFVHILTLYPVISLDLLGGYMLTILRIDVRPYSQPYFSRQMHVCVKVNDS